MKLFFQNDFVFKLYSLVKELSLFHNDFSARNFVVITIFLIIAWLWFCSSVEQYLLRIRLTHVSLR